MGEGVRMGNGLDRAAARHRHDRKRLEDEHRKIDMQIKDEELHYGDSLLIRKMKRDKLGMKDRLTKMGREEG